MTRSESVESEQQLSNCNRRFGRGLLYCNPLRQLGNNTGESPLDLDWFSDDAQQAGYESSESSDGVFGGQNSESERAILMPNQALHAI